MDTCTFQFTAIDVGEVFRLLTHVDQLDVPFTCNPISPFWLALYNLISVRTMFMRPQGAISVIQVPVRALKNNYNIDAGHPYTCPVTPSIRV